MKLPNVGTARARKGTDRFVTLYRRSLRAEVRHAAALSEPLRCAVICRKVVQPERFPRPRKKRPISGDANGDLMPNVRCFRRAKGLPALSADGTLPDPLHQWRCVS